jgi:hypothetical protein
MPCILTWTHSFPTPDCQRFSALGQLVNQSTTRANKKCGEKDQQMKLDTSHPDYEKYLQAVEVRNERLRNMFSLAFVMSIASDGGGDL